MRQHCFVGRNFAIFLKKAQPAPEKARPAREKSLLSREPALLLRFESAQTREAPTGPHLGQLTADEPRLSSSLDVHVLNTIVLFSTLGVVEAV